MLTRHKPEFGSLVEYMTEGSRDNEGKVHILTHNIRSKTLHGIEREFIENEAYRPPGKKRIYVYHVILSLSANENNALISNDMLEAITRKYISLRGKTGIYMAALHRSEQHPHIHIAIGGAEYRTGRAFRQSRQALAELKIGLQTYHTRQFPELGHSTVAHGRGGHREKTDRQWQAEHRRARDLVKEQVRSVVEKCFRESRTQKECIRVLQAHNIHVYERGTGVPTGIISDGVKVRFSRLGIAFDSLPPDITEQERTLAAIRQIRRSREERSRNISERER